jgi:hypothetical protein
MIHYGVHFHAPRVVRAAEKLRSGFALVGLQPIGYGSPGQRLCRCQGYYRQLADRLKLFCHLDMLVFAPDARCLMAGDRVGNPLRYIVARYSSFSYWRARKMFR